MFFDRLRRLYRVNSFAAATSVAATGGGIKNSTKDRLVMYDKITHFSNARRCHDPADAVRQGGRWPNNRFLSYLMKLNTTNNSFSSRYRCSAGARGRVIYFVRPRYLLLSQNPEPYRLKCYHNRSISNNPQNWRVFGRHARSPRRPILV